MWISHSLANIVQCPVQNCDKHSILMYFQQSLHMCLWGFALNYLCLWLSFRKPVPLACYRGSSQEYSELGKKPTPHGHATQSSFGNFHSASPIPLCHSNGMVLHLVGNLLSGFLLALQVWALTGSLNVVKSGIFPYFRDKSWTKGWETWCIMIPIAGPSHRLFLLLGILSPVLLFGFPNFSS